MNEKELKGILEKYMNGETSLEEEKVLRRYFLSNSVSEDLLPYQSIFTVFSSEKETILNLDNDIELPFTTKITLWKSKYWAIAASVLILFGSWYLLQEPEIQKEKLSNEEMVLVEKYLSSGLVSFDKAYNQSANLLKKTLIIQKKTSEVTNLGVLFDENLKKISNLDLMDESLNRIQNISKIRKSKIKIKM